MAKDNINTTAPEAEAKNYPPLTMEATVRIPTEASKNLLGFANVTFNGVLTVTDFKVLQEKETGALFAAMPSKPVGGGKYNTTTWLKTDEAKAQLQKTVLTAYDAAVENLKKRAADLAGQKPFKEQLEEAGKQAAAHNEGLESKGRGKNKDVEH